MFELVEILENNKLYNDADKLQKYIVSNNFMLNKKKITPGKQLNNKIDALSTQMADMKDSVEDSGSDSSEPKIMLDNNQVEFKQK